MPDATTPASNPVTTDESLKQANRASTVNEMKQWAEDFKINKPIPRDLVLLLAKDGVKQLEIVMKNVILEREGKKT
jgi:hypothetical protein